MIDLTLEGTGGGGTAVDVHNLGWFATPEALRQDHQTANNGDFAIVGTTDSVWTWDSDTTSWVDTKSSGLVESVNGKTGTVVLKTSDIENDSGYITKDEQDLTYYPTSAEVNDLLKGKADDNKVVHNTGAETISGVKEFTSGILVGALKITSPVAAISADDGIIIRNTTTGETVVSNTNGSTNGLCLRPNGTDESEGQVLINKDGSITATAIKDENGDSLYTETSLNNLDETGEDRLTVCKGYTVSSITTDSKTVTEVKNMMQNLVKSAGSDTLKAKNYTLIGTPVISTDGIANSFSNGNAIKTGININVQESVEIRGKFTLTSLDTGSTTVPYVLGTDRWRLDVTKNENDISVYATNDLDVSLNTRFNISIPESIDNTVFEFIDTITKTSRSVKVIVNGSNVYEGSSTFASSQVLEETGLTIGSSALDGMSDYYWHGLVDLNTFKVILDGLLFYQPCLIIPYTLCTNGCKIVNSQYRDRVFDAYDQFGYALYYTLDSTNNNVTLPLGNIYGMFASQDVIGNILNALQIINGTGA